jgi:hypothetical protein
MEGELKTVRGRKFVDETVSLDGTEFIDCVFERCELTYSGRAPFLFENTPLNGCNIAFEGPARRTMEALATMHRFGMHAFVEQMFERVRNPFQDSIQ